MKGSIERVRAILAGGKPDRVPLFELIRNDAVIEHFTGEKLTLENGQDLVYRTFEPSVDATRPRIRPPQAEGETVRPDGRKQRHFRWTTWTERAHYADPDSYAAAKRKLLDNADPQWNDTRQARLDEWLAGTAEHRRRLGEVFLFPGAPGRVELHGTYNEIGIEQFTFVWAAYPELVDELLEHKTIQGVQNIQHLPDDHGVEAVFLGDDIAHSTGPMFSPAFFETYYFHRLKRVVDAYHARGIKVLFHSDGDLNLIMDGLVGAGIDGLNPIEVLAHMDVADLHRRYPKLFFVGAIDVSQLLPYGTPDQVRDTVHRTIDAAEGQIMIGSSTELHEAVPLENFLAMREAALGHSLR